MEKKKRPDTGALLRGLAARQATSRPRAEKLGKVDFDTPARERRPPESPPLLVTAAPDPGATDEKRAIMAAGEAAEALLNRPDYRMLLGAMIGFRRCYAVAYRELYAMLEAEPEGTVPELTADTIIGSSAYAAAAAFDERELMEGIIETVLPWLGGVVDRHIVGDQAAQAEEAARALEERRARPIPIGVTHHRDQDDNVLGRDRGLVLVGYGPAVVWVADRIVEHVLAAGDFQVVRFLDAPPSREESHQRLVRLAPNTWRGCANVANGVPTVMGTYVADHLSRQPDLLVVDDLPAAYTRGFAGRPPLADAGDAHRRFAAWCEKAAAAFIGLVQLPDQSGPDLSQMDSEQVRTFAHTRGVFVRPGPSDDHYHVHVGDGSVLVAPKAELEAAGRRRVIVTGR